MSENLQDMTNRELAAYIKANRGNDEACSLAIELLINRQPVNTPRYPHDLTDEDMEKIFREKLRSLDRDKH
jgi:hypothetical protein